MGWQPNPINNEGIQCKKTKSSPNRSKTQINIIQNHVRLGKSQQREEFVKSKGKLGQHKRDEDDKGEKQYTKGDS